MTPFLAVVTTPLRPSRILGFTPQVLLAVLPLTATDELGDQSSRKLTSLKLSAKVKVLVEGQHPNASQSAGRGLVPTAVKWWRSTLKRQNSEARTDAHMHSNDIHS